MAKSEFYPYSILRFIRSSVRGKQTCPARFVSGGGL